jgi:SAM-dependent methyltransferase
MVGKININKGISKLMEETNCNLCNSSQYSVLYFLDDFLLDRKSVETRLVKCENCGLIYQNPRPSLEEMSLSYPTNYDSYVSESKLSKNSWLMNKAINYGLNKRSSFVTNHKSSGSLLDIGCSTGLFLNNMQQNSSWELKGVEINSHAAKLARDLFELDVFTGTLEEASFPDDYFDVVTLWDVLEHLHNPSASLHEIHRILKPDGILVFRVPNGKSWNAKFFGQYWAGLDAPRHLYVFEQFTLKRMLEKVGYISLQMSSRGGGYPTFILSIRFWLTGKGYQESTRKIIIKFFDHPILRLLTSPIFLLNGMGLRGPLITVIAKKKQG